MSWRLYPFVFVAVLGWSATARAGFILNGSFETVPPGGATGQGLLPTGWIDVSAFFPIGADTYSNDGSYGAFPSTFGNFSGITAFDGIRFVAGASFGRLAGTSTIGGEAFATALTAPLTAGTAYRLDTVLHQALRSDLNNPGGYDLFLASDSTPAGLSGSVKVGSLNPTTGSTAWEARSLTFTAPADVATRPYLVFAQYQSGEGNSYTAIDAVSINAFSVSAAPEPSSLFLAVAGVTAFAVFKSRRRYSSCRTVFA
jgi:hypothetical protein